MDDRSFHSLLSKAESSDGVARDEDTAYICDIDVVPPPLPTIGALGSVIRRASLIATAVHACEVASVESRIRRQSWIGHGSEARA